MFFKIQLIMFADDDRSMKTLYRNLYYFSTLSTEINDDAVPKNAPEMFRKFNVYWIDEDSHRVMINTEMDFNCMFEKFKYYTTEKPKLYLEERRFLGAPPLGPIQNWGFVCSKCSIQITGFLYKCTECENFNLCSKCEFRKLHKEHVMLRFNSPDDENSFNENFLVKKKSPNSACPILSGTQKGIGCSTCGDFHEQEIPIIDKNLLKTGVEVLGNLSEMLSKMVSSSGSINRATVPESIEKESKDWVAVKQRRYSDATTFGYRTEDTDPVIALTTLFDRFRETIIQAEDKIIHTPRLDKENESGTKTSGDEKVEKAVKEMIAKGYSNKGNWLDHLLVASDGDVNRAIEMLKPLDI